MYNLLSSSRITSTIISKIILLQYSTIKPLPRYPTTLWKRDDECDSWIFGGFSLTVHCFGERKKIYSSLKAIYILNTILIKFLFLLTCLYDNLYCVPFLSYPFVTLRQICFKLLGVYCLWAFFKLPLRKFILYIPTTTTNFNYFKG